MVTSVISVRIRRLLMLTYTFAHGEKKPLYEQLTDFIKMDISTGVVPAGTKLPSKRAFAEHLGISTITVETAYQQLIAEGYIHSVPRSGYYVSDIDPNRSGLSAASKQKAPAMISEEPEKQNKWMIDFSGNETAPDTFPFQTWAKLIREVLSGQTKELVKTSPGIGIRSLREAIATHLYHFRGMNVDPGCIIIGAGTEYLYGLLIQLLGFDRTYGVEDPGHQKIPMIYEQNGVLCRHLSIKEPGITPEMLEQEHVDILHISPAHHFPTGRVMPIRQRLSLLKWASEGKDRYIIEDDYDSEFRMVGQPIPSLLASDHSGKVIYMNTFTKTLVSTVRISYMVLPRKLMQLFRERLSFYSCTVSNFEQYTLAAFLEKGYFEKHLNRMRTYYHNKRDRILKLLTESPLAPSLRITEADAGLHFLLLLDMNMTDQSFTDLLAAEGIRITPLSDYYHDPSDAPEHIFIVNYSSLSEEHLPDAAEKMAQLLRKE